MLLEKSKIKIMEYLIIIIIKLIIDYYYLRYKMNILMILFFGAALAMDAFGVSIGIGINSLINRSKKIKYIISFGLFQFLLTLLGGILGYYFECYVAEIPNIIGGVVIGIVGILMIIDGKKNSDSLLIKDSMVFTLGISVSIDAFVVGFSVIHKLGTIKLLAVNSLLIGLITSFLCTLAFFLCRYIRKITIVSKYADYMGGIILILFGIKMFFGI